MEYAIETVSLTKIFSDWWGRNKVVAVDDLNLKVNYNEVYGLLGPNGSGKTTTLKMLLGLLYPTKGKSIVLGGVSTDTKISARIGFMPEESYLYRYLNARETLDFYARLFKLPSEVRKMRIEALLDMVGLKAVANRPVGTYSKGMARRIGLAQALINDPELLILDEPTTGLDPIGTRQIKDLILKLAERGKTILLCSHLLADVEDVCDRISILYGGRVQTEGQVHQLLRQTDKKQITTGHLSEATLDKIKQLVEEENADYEVTSPMDKLETFFIRTVAQAQQQAQPTSGAVTDSKAPIADFLTAEAGEEAKRRAVLDKLVTETISSASSSEEVSTEAPIPEQISQTKADDDFLNRLTKHKDSDLTEDTTQQQELTESIDVQPDSSQQEPGENILDQLTGRNSQEDNTNNEEDVKRAGDAENA
ncbi:MAG: ABC transporter ATP-binding protein [Planctomycetota bacterium]|jgi:ABC-2 type transport system ATP-binding protein